MPDAGSAAGERVRYEQSDNVSGGIQIDIRQALKRSHDSWFGRAMRLFDRPVVSDEIWTELEELLVLADVGVSTTEKLIDRVKQRITREKGESGERVRAVLKEEMVSFLRLPPPEVVESRSSPHITLVVGVNGGGKTTSIAKLAKLRKKEGKQVLLAAADTFRAAAIEQLKLQGERVGVEVIAHRPGADPGAVVYDALQAAQSRQVDEVVIDTAGRLHTRINLMEELKKVRKVAGRFDATAPHEVTLVIDATTGQNGLAQAKYFTAAVGVTEIFLAKLDGTARGGVVLSICDELGIPIRYIGTGEGLEDVSQFDAAAFVEAICN